MELNMLMNVLIVILQVASVSAIVKDKESSHPLLASLFRTANRVPTTRRVPGHSRLQLLSHRPSYSIHDAKRYYNKFVSQYGTQDSSDDKPSKEYTSGSVTSPIMSYPSRRLRPTIRDNRQGILQRRLRCRHCNFGRRRFVPRGSIFGYPSVRRWTPPRPVMRPQGIPSISNSIVPSKPIEAKSPDKAIVSNEFHTRNEVSVKPVNTINANIPKLQDTPLNPSHQILNNIPTSVLKQVIASPQIDNVIMNVLNKQSIDTPVAVKTPPKPISILTIGESTDKSYTLPFVPKPHLTQPELPLDVNGPIISNTMNKHPVLGAKNTLGTNIQPVNILDKQVPVIDGHINSLDKQVHPVLADKQLLDTHKPLAIGSEQSLNLQVPPVIGSVKHLPPAMGEILTQDKQLPPIISDVNTVNSHIPPIMGDVNTLGSQIPSVMGNVNTLGSHISPAMSDFNTLSDQTPPLIGEINVPSHSANTIHPTVDAIQGNKLNAFDTIDQFNGNHQTQEFINKHIPPLDTFRPNEGNTHIVPTINGIVGNFDLVNLENNNGYIIDPSVIPNLNVIGDILQNNVSPQGISTIDKLPIETAVHSPSNNMINHNLDNPVTLNEVQVEKVVPKVNILATDIHQESFPSNSIPLVEGSKADMNVIPLQVGTGEVSHSLDKSLDETMIGHQSSQLGIPKHEPIITSIPTETIHAGDGFLSLPMDDVGLQQPQMSPFDNVNGLNLQGQNEIVNSIVDNIPVSVVTIGRPEQKSLDITNEFLVPEQVMQPTQNVDTFNFFGEKSQVGVPVGHVEQDKMNHPRDITKHAGDVPFVDQMPSDKNNVHEDIRMKETVTPEQLGVIVNDLIQPQLDVSANMGIPINVNDGFIGPVPSNVNNEPSLHVNMEETITPLAKQVLPPSLDQHVPIVNSIDQQPIRTPSIQQVIDGNLIGLDAHGNPEITLSRGDILTTGLMEKTPVTVEPVGNQQDFAVGVSKPIIVSSLPFDNPRDTSFQGDAIQPAFNSDVAAAHDLGKEQPDNSHQINSVINDLFPSMPLESTGISNHASDGLIDIVPLGDQSNSLGSTIVGESMTDPMLSQFPSDNHLQPHPETITLDQQVVIPNDIKTQHIETISPQHQTVDTNTHDNHISPETVLSPIDKIMPELVKKPQVHVEQIGSQLKGSSDTIGTTFADSSSSIDVLPNMDVITNVQVQEIPQANNPAIFTTKPKDVAMNDISDSAMVSHSSDPVGSIDMIKQDVIQHVDRQNSLLKHHNQNEIVDNPSTPPSEHVPHQVHTDRTVHVTGIAPNGSSVTVELSDILPAEFLANGGDPLIHFLEHGDHSSNNEATFHSHDSTHNHVTGTLPASTHLEHKHEVSHSNNEISPSITTTQQPLTAEHLPEIMGTGDWVVLLSLPGTENSNLNTNVPSNNASIHQSSTHTVHEHKPIVSSAPAPIPDINIDVPILSLDELLMGGFDRSQETQNINNNVVNISSSVSSNAINDVVGGTTTHTMDTQTEALANIETNPENVATETTIANTHQDIKSQILENPTLQVNGQFADLLTLLSDPSITMNDIVSTDILQMLVNAELNSSGNTRAHGINDGSSTAL